MVTMISEVYEAFRAGASKEKKQETRLDPALLAGNLIDDYTNKRFNGYLIGINSIYKKPETKFYTWDAQIGQRLQVRGGLPNIK